MTSLNISGNTNDTNLVLNSNYASITDDYAAATSAEVAALSSGLALKADASALSSGLALKADASALTSGLALKADSASVTAQKVFNARVALEKSSTSSNYIFTADGIKTLTDNHLMSLFNNPISTGDVKTYMKEALDENDLSNNSYRPSNSITFGVLDSGYHLMDPVNYGGFGYAPARAKIAINEAIGNNGLNNGNSLYIDNQHSMSNVSYALSNFVDNNAKIIVGPQFSGNSQTLIPLAVDAKIPMISYSATAADLDTISPYFSRTCPNDEGVAAKIAEQINNNSITKTIVLYDSSKLNLLSLHDKFKLDFEAASGSVVSYTYLSDSSGAVEIAAADVSNDAIASLVDTNADVSCAVYMLGFWDKEGKNLLEKVIAKNNSNIKEYYLSEGFMNDTSNSYIQMFQDVSNIVYYYGAKIPASFSYFDGLNGLSLAYWSIPFGTAPAYDAGALAVLAVAMGGTDLSLVENIGLLSNKNPSDNTYYPGQLQAALTDISNGNSINYQGGSYTSLVQTSVGGYEPAPEFDLFIPNLSTNLWEISS